MLLALAYRSNTTAQGKREVQPDAVADDFGGETVSTIHGNSS